MSNDQPRPTGQPPREKRPPEPGDVHRFQRWAVLLVAAALIGGLAAAALTRESVLWAVAFSLIIAAVALCALAGGLLDDSEASRRPPRKRRRPSHSADQPAPARSDLAPPLPRPGQPGAAGAAPARNLDGAAPDIYRSPSPRLGSGTRIWWDQPGAEPGALPAAAPPADDRVPRHARLPAGRAARGDQGQIAQCPECGSFRVDVDTQAVPPWQFGCHECRHGWVWRPGVPWPSVQVKPSARRPAERPGG
jgi:hypothetical protein